MFTHWHTFPVAYRPTWNRFVCQTLTEFKASPKPWRQFVGNTFSLVLSQIPQQRSSDNLSSWPGRRIKLDTSSETGPARKIQYIYAPGAYRYPEPQTLTAYCLTVSRGLACLLPLIYRIDIHLKFRMCKRFGSTGRPIQSTQVLSL